MKTTVNDADDLKNKNPDSEELKESGDQQTTQKESEHHNVQVKELEQEIATLKEKNDQLQDQFLRSRAEIANMNNHFKNERAQLLMYGGQNLAKDILPGIDNLKRALATKTDGKSSEQLKKGIEMVFNQLSEALKSNEIIEIAETGVEFDPTIHQAVSVVEATDDEKQNMVKEILQSGYKLKDRVIRPAMVVVTK
ncbi:nucleotide exchange factor GrpE [Xylocopilactobacillus apicola]|uniref:Protein GrpE n=1 Tax=Xylocopilactobacillus apicola TaxID=2932184 RepID=A0AAU9DIU3_9LACO|nr:nucleotide exchange factor GrpE [Xylocopilactobacillus apicola]BDR58351.1 protein GrpE [Xylocopilactobacillus apicola]